MTPHRLPAHHPSSNHPNNNSDRDDNEEDDRKPPARLIVVPKKDDDDDNHHSDDDSTGLHPTDASHSVGSISTAAAPPIIIEKPPRQQQQQQQPSTTLSISLPRNNNNDDDDTQQQQQHDRRSHAAYSEVIFWGGSAALSLVTFLYVILPTAALTALSALLASMYMLLTSGMQRAIRYEYQRLLHSPQGLGAYLPTGLYQTLTQTSWHDWFTDSTFFLENRHLLVYLLPLSEEQLQQYLQRLAPHRRERLQRPGVGHSILTPAMMRLVMGDEQYQRQNAVNATNANVINTNNNNNSNNNNNAVRVPQTTTSRGMLLQRQEEEDSEMSDNNNETPPQEQDDLQQQQQQLYNQEEQAISDAIVTSMYSSIWNPVVSYTRRWTRSFLRPVSQGLLGVSLVSTGSGWFLASHHHHRFWNNVAQRQQRAEQTAWTMAAASGAAAVFAYGMYWYCGSKEETTKKTKCKK